MLQSVSGDVKIKVLVELFQKLAGSCMKIVFHAGQRPKSPSADGETPHACKAPAGPFRNSIRAADTFYKIPD